jgi:hypothetical protein
MLLEKSFLLLLFILVSITFLTLLALNIDFLNRLRFIKANWGIKKTTFHTQIDDISHYLNSRVLTNIQMEEVIKICPVKAIKKVENPETHFIVSEQNCIGLSCLECMKRINQI